jgi:XRE family transcriptional regulator, regulator of sulfur utilization
VQYIVKGGVLDQLNSVIAENLKKLREERRLSLDNLAKLSGVSKSMLGQIERGEVNPTVSTVWKISNGLKISFTQLMSRPETEIELVEKTGIQPFVEDDGKVRNFPVFPFDSKRRFEMYSLELDSQGHIEAEAHPPGTQEFITVFAGEVTVSLNGDAIAVTDGNSLRFMADAPHAYTNTGSVMCSLSMVIYYP